ncbi:hypothetical protein CFC21_005059 [Triticum aestivum]|uniref:KEN domain-containing protein n=2 Tax=Triticum aestivum TaxID=4565 RepID=A0A9R1D8T5_WHEAT|nr:uncharacterized protein LOC123104758 [Triticum aestivum]KAF6987408.1 hypothetical protein CFC21_005059 [Triticum aestivum]
MNYNQVYKTVYQNTSRQGQCTVSVKKEKYIDTNKNETDLHEAIYKVGPLEVKCLVKEDCQSDPAPFQSYCILQDFRHLNIVSIENYYFDECGEGRMVLSWVDQTLRGWLVKVADEKHRLKAFESTCMSCKPSTIFRKMVIGMCDAVQCMLKNNVYPCSILLDDIYLVNHASPTVKILVSDVIQIYRNSHRISHERLIWKDVREVVEECVTIAAKRAIHPDAKRFFQYIGFASVKKLESYPDTWNDQDKIQYLLHVMSGKKNYVSSKVNGIRNFNWPKENSGHLPRLFRDLKDHQEKETKSTYNTNDPYDYLRLCRNGIKHWDLLPSHITIICGDVSGFLRYIERWNPGIWCDLYEALEA